MKLKGISGQEYTLDTKPFSSGGEGDIYSVIGRNDRCAKVYHYDRVSEELEAKIKVMLMNPPNSAVLSQVAWPLDIIYDSVNSFSGFIMPRLDISEELTELYKYPPQKYAKISIQQKLVVAGNICAVISAVHSAGYVFGDFNPRNIGVNLKTGNVAFLDTDSYHIHDRQTGRTFRCEVCLDGYVAPELLEKCEPYKHDAYAMAPLPTFTQETDNFSLAIHMFKLLMNGYTPFNGIKETETVSMPSPGHGNQAIKRDSYCFKPGNKPQAVAVPPVSSLSQEIEELFTRAFIDGKTNPESRPTAREWHKALLDYEKCLRPCVKISYHQYKNSLHTCPWCEADRRYAEATASVIPQRMLSTPIVSAPVIPTKNAVPKVKSSSASPTVMPPPPQLAKVPLTPSPTLRPPPLTIRTQITFSDTSNKN